MQRYQHTSRIYLESINHMKSRKEARIFAFYFSQCDKKLLKYLLCIQNIDVLFICNQENREKWRKKH